MYPRGGVRTVNVANPTNGYAAEKGISKVASDGEWKPYSNFDTKSIAFEPIECDFCFDLRRFRTHCLPLLCAKIALRRWQKLTSVVVFYR